MKKHLWHISVLFRGKPSQWAGLLFALWDMVYFSQALFKPYTVGIPLPVPCQRNHIHWLQSQVRFRSQPFWWDGEKGQLRKTLAAQPRQADSVGAPGITGMMVKPTCDKWGLPHQTASKGFSFCEVSIVCRAGKAGRAPSC